MVVPHEANLQNHVSHRKDIYRYSHRYFGSPDINLVNEDFERLTEEERKDYSVRKEILWESEDCSESELAEKEVEFIRKFKSNDPDIGYNRWPKLSNNRKTSSST